MRLSDEKFEKYEADVRGFFFRFMLMFFVFVVVWGGYEILLAMNSELPLVEGASGSECSSINYAKIVQDVILGLGAPFIALMSICIALFHALWRARMVLNHLASEASSGPG